MNSLKIPQLNLFNSRRDKFQHGVYDKIQQHSEGLIRASKTDRQFIREKDIFVPSLTYDRLYEVEAARMYQPILPMRYKQIADNYLYRAPLIDHYQMPLLANYGVNSSPIKKPLISSRRCECQNDEIKHVGHEININKNPYLSKMNLKNLNNKDVRIQKDAYLIPTFRQKVIGLQKQIKQNPESMKSSLIDNLNLKENNKKQNIMIIEKLKTHQSADQENHNKKVTNQVQIQTETNNNENCQNQQSKKIKKRDQSTLERILQEQQYALQSLYNDIQDEQSLKVNLNDLLMSKDEIMQKSKEILLKLNDFSDDKKEFSFFSKSSTNKRMHNPFGILNLE